MRKYLSAKDLGKLTKRGRYAAGPNLYLQISEWGTRAWIFRYRIDGRHRHMGLGAADLLTLQEAREKAHAARRQLKIDGIDPIEAKQAAKRERMLASARDKTFKDVALDYIAAHEDHWRGDGSRQQWLQSLEKHVFPKIGNTPVGDIDVADVLSVLDPMRSIPETAKRVRNRIANILDWAAARDLRPHDNPAKRPNLLPKGKRRVKHFAAMPYADVPAFMAELRQRPEGTARMLEFLILTTARPGEALGMRWSEVEGNVWKVPGERMKGSKEHRVPLSERAVELLANLPREGEYVFPGDRTGAQPHPMVLVSLLRRMGHDVTTAHGFRSTFRDWAAEQTSYANHVVEMALAHAIGNGVEAAYRRGDLFEKRRRLMDDWASYCSRPTAGKGEVVTLRTGAT
jgi:integrase